MLEYNEMAEHQQRVVDEYHELDGRLSRLFGFIANSDTFKTLPVEEQERLRKQSEAMAEYKAVLKAPITAFSGE